jgi:probable HAF family extracellular repeat protein
MTPTSRLVAIHLSVLASVLPLSADLKFTPTGLLSGGTYGYAAISADGSVIACRDNSVTVTYEQAATWTASGGMVGLGDLPGGPSTSGSTANAISADGSVVVGYGTAAGRTIPSGGSTALTQEAFRWTSATGLVSLGVLSGSYLGTEARSVSADGSVIVGVGYNASGFPEAFRWTAATGLQSLGFLPGCNQSTATGVSADGSVIVGFSKGTGIPEKAFRWTQAGGMVELGTLPSGYVSSHANAISADGLVVVGQIATAVGGDGSANREAFRWTQAGGYVVLGDLPGIEVRSEAHAVSSDGSVVVGYATGSTFADSSFIWDATNGLRSLRTILTQAGFASGWSLSSATGISGDGTRIAGFGSPSSGQSTVWLLDLNAPPPPPASVALVWTESGPQPGPGQAGPSILRLGYDNGVVGPDIATHTGPSGGNFNGVEYANGLILIANQGTGGSRVHDPRYSPIIVSNVVAYDLDATPGFLWQATGGAQQIIKSNTSATLTGTGVHDRTYSTATNQLNLARSTGFFANALQTVGSSVYFSSSITAPIGLHVLNFTDGTTSPVFTAGSPSIYDFEIVDDHIYFGNIANNTIQRVKTDGTGLVTLVTGATFVNGIDVTDTHIYWSELTTGLIRRANLDGSAAVTLIEGRSGLRGVAVLPLSLTTGPAPQALSIGGLTNLAFRYTNAKDTPVPLTPASTSGLPVTLEIVSGPATLSGNSITYTGIGTVVVRATQSGDSSFAPATFTTSVNAAPRLGQTISFPQPANVTYSGTPIVVTPAASASSGLAVNYSLVSGPATYNSANKTFTVTGTGSITIRATQTGDTTYAPAAFVERTFTSSAPGADPLADFLIAAGVPANLRGPNDDADNDNLDNLLEYALDLNPNGTGGSFTGTPPSLSTTPTLFQLTYRRVRNDVTYVVQTSPTLVGETWTSAGVTQGTPAGDGATTASIPLGTVSAFLRLVVTKNP